MALVERYVNTSVATSGDGSQATPWKHLAEAFPTGALPPGLTGGGVDEYVVHYTGTAADSTQVRINSLYAGMTITVEGNATGKKDLTVARLTANPSGAAEGAVEVTGNVTLLTLRRVQIRAASSLSDRYCVRGNGVLSILLDRCVIDASNLTNATGVFAVMQAGDAKIHMRSTVVIVPATARAAVSKNSNGTSYMHNCTLVCNNATAASKGIAYGAGTQIVRNSRLVNFATDADAGVAANSESNATTSATTALPGTQTGQTFTFVDAANGDYHVTAGDTFGTSGGVDLSADPNLAVTADVDGDPITTSWPIGYDYYSVPVTADRIEPSAQPAATYNVGDTATLGFKAVQGAGGPTQTTLNTGTVTVRARTAPPGWDLTHALDTDTWAAGVVAPSFQIPMAGTWSFGADDDSDALIDSPDTNSTTVTLAAGGGGSTIITGDDGMQDILKGGTAARLTIEFQALDATGAPVTGLTGTPSIRINSGASATSNAAGAATELGGGYYAVQVVDANIAAGDRVRVTAFSTAARIVGGYARVVAVDVATAPQTLSLDGSNRVVPTGTEDDGAGGYRFTATALAQAPTGAGLTGQQATDLANAATASAAAKTAAESVDGKLTTARATKLDNLDATVTSRASAADYTTARAAKLDNLDAAVSTAGGGLTPAQDALLTKIAKEVAQGGQRGIRSGDTVTLTIEDADGNVVGTRTVTYRSATSNEIATIGPIV